MNIGRAADQSGLPVKTIRYYEEIGLVKPQRRDNGYRDYCCIDSFKRRWIQRARSWGFEPELQLVSPCAVGHGGHVPNRCRDGRSRTGPLSKVSIRVHSYRETLRSVSRID